jgi:hypothetical protein
MLKGSLLAGRSPPATRVGTYVGRRLNRTQVRRQAPPKRLFAHASPIETAILSYDAKNGKSF